MKNLEARISLVVRKLKKECVKQTQQSNKLISKRLKAKPNLLRNRELEFKSIEKLGFSNGLDFAINELELLLEKYRKKKPNDE